MKIIVDADACPVKQEINKAAALFQVNVIFVASYNHFSPDLTGENWLFVDTIKEAADMRIVNIAEKDDIVVSQDVGLASILLSKGIIVFSNRGERYYEKDMPLMLEKRYERLKERRRGHYGKGPKAFIDKDRERFFENIVAYLTNYKNRR